MDSVKAFSASHVALPGSRLGVPKKLNPDGERDILYHRTHCSAKKKLGEDEGRRDVTWSYGICTVE